MAKANPEIDFENFTVEKERADLIRGDLAKLKESGWLEDFRLLAVELGVEEAPGEAGTQVELIGHAKAKNYRGAAGTPAEGLHIVAADHDLIVRFAGKSVLEVMALPKAGEFAILHCDEAFWNLLEAIGETVKDDVKAARSAKTARSARFKNFGQAAQS